MSIELKHKAGQYWGVMEGENELAQIKGNKKEALQEFEEWKVENGFATEKPGVEASGEPVDINKARSELEGLALTAKLNETVDTNIVADEWSPRAGIFNESNKVEGVPRGWRAIWAIPRTVDGGQHEAWLRQRGCRPVYREEMADSPYDSKGMFVNWMDEGSGEYVEQSGARLLIGPVSKLDKLRELEYSRTMDNIDRVDEQSQELAARIGDQPIRVERHSGAYDPMGRS